VYGYNLRLSKEPSLPEIIKELSDLELSNYKEVVFTGLGNLLCAWIMSLNYEMAYYPRDPGEA